MSNGISLDQIKSLYDHSMMDLLYQAQSVHRENFDPNTIETCSLLSVKTGACPEDCKYCSQSGHHNSEIKKEKLMDVELVVQQAHEAKEQGAKRFCMGAAWRNPPKKDFPKVIEMVQRVKKMGLETCLTLGMLDQEQSEALKEAGLDYYNHNLDTSPEYYEKIITTRSYQDRLDTLEHVRAAGIHVCCGGIIGMGENREDRVALLYQLANLPEQPKSVPINRLMPMKGTPLAEVHGVDDLEFVRTIAVTRIIMPQSMVRLSAGRDEMSDTMQTLCFFAGANSIFLGDKLLTAANPEACDDMRLLKNLGMSPLQKRATEYETETY